jgi:hypothetical protein
VVAFCVNIAQTKHSTANPPYRVAWIKLVLLYRERRKIHGLSGQPETQTSTFDILDFFFSRETIKIDRQ